MTVDTPNHYKVENNTLIVDPPIEHGLYTEHFYTAFHGEHVISFMEQFGIEADYLDPKRVAGRYNEQYGNWSGMMGHVGFQSGRFED